MRILHIASGDFFSTYGGGQVYVKNVTDGMLALGYDIAIISEVNQTNNIAVKDYKGAPLIEIASGKHLQEAIQLANPDIIHAHSLKPEAAQIGYKLGIPVVVTAHHGGIVCPAGTLMNHNDRICTVKANHKDCLRCVVQNILGGKVWYPMVKFWSQSAYLRIGQQLSKTRVIPFLTPIGIAACQIAKKQTSWDTIAQHCSAMIAPSQRFGELLKLNQLPEAKLHVIPHGIPLPQSVASYPDVAKGKIKFYFAGRICRIKGLHILLDALSHVPSNNLELHLIGGTGNKAEQRYLNSLKKKYSKDTRIIWHGKISPEEMYQQTEQFHVAIAPSICLEAFGLNIAEALALGKPVLTTTSGGGEMQIINNVNGWLVPSNNPEALAAKINEILQHKEILPQISLNCSAIAIDKHCQALQEVYSKLLTK